LGVPSFPLIQAMAPCNFYKDVGDLHVG